MTNKTEPTADDLDAEKVIARTPAYRTDGGINGPCLGKLWAQMVVAELAAAGFVIVRRDRA